MRYNLDVVTTPYVEPLVAFANEYGLMVIGALLLLASFSGRRFGPLALVPMLVGLGLVIAGAAHLMVPIIVRM